jgi:hypothetical protein
MIIHYVNERQLQYLETLFAIYTQDGWVIPAWLVYLRETAK